MGCSHTMECSLVIKRKKVLIHVQHGGTPGDIMLNERSKAQKATYCVIPFV